MANKRGQGIQIREFDPKGAQMGALAPIERPSGKADAATFEVASHLTKQVNAFADELAVSEGQRAGQVAGADPSFRPSNGFTLRARASDAAATQVYMSNLTAKFTSDAMDLYQQNDKDPVAFKSGYESLIKTYEQQHVFPEAAGMFRAKATNIATSLRGRVLDNFETAQKDHRRAQFLESETAAVTGQQRLLAADPDSPATEANLQSTASERKLRVDGLVTNGDISAEAGAKRKIEIDNETASSIVLSRARTKTTPEDLAAYRKEVREKFEAGKIPGLADWESVDAQIERLGTHRVAETQKLKTSLSRDLTDFVDREKDNWNPSSGEWIMLQSRGRQLGEDGSRLVAEAELKLKLGRQIAALPLDKAEATQATIERNVRERGGNPIEVEGAKYSRSVLEARRKAMGQDPIGAGEREFGVQAGTLDLNAPPETIAAGLAQRIPAALTIAQQSGRKATYLRPEEKERAQAVLDAGGDKALALIDGIVRGGRDQATAILAEIGEGAPALAHAGALVAETGDKSFARQVAELRKAEKAAPGGRLPQPSERDVQEILREEYGTALNGFNSSELARTKDAAIAWTRVELARRGIDAKDGDADVKAVLKEGLQRARGMTSQGDAKFGGVGEWRNRGWIWDDVARVEVPPNIRQDKFQDVINAITAEDLAGLKNPPVRGDKVLTAKELRFYTPVNGPDGYRFVSIEKGSNVTRYVRGRDGSPFVLPLDEMTPELRKRVPSAFK